MTVIGPRTPSSSRVSRPLRSPGNLTLLSARFVDSVGSNVLWLLALEVEVGCRLHEEPYLSMDGSMVYTACELLPLTAASAAVLITVLFSSVFWDSHQHH